MKTHSSIFWLPPLLGLAALLAVSCSEDRTGDVYQTHTSDWTDPSSSASHGPAAIASKGANCTPCHGADYRGAGDAGSCYECHGSLHVGVKANEPQTHQVYLAAAGWNLARCARCHGTDYAGGTSGFNCNTCHTASGGPAACGTCHALPPVNDAGLPYGMREGAAGAHAVHQRFGCGECHPAVTGVTHADALPAEVTFAAARFATAHGFNPVFAHVGNANSGNGSCASVYCHSDGRGHAATIMPQWTAGGIGCTACHQLPPPSPHPARPLCHECHTNVDPASNYGSPTGIRFLVDSLHVNGIVNF